MQNRPYNSDPYVTRTIIKDGSRISSLHLLFLNKHGLGYKIRLGLH